MTQVVIEGAIAEQLKRTADAEQISVEDLLRALLKAYEESSLVWTPERKAAADAAIEAGAGMFDDDVTDLSTTVRETMQKRFGAKADDERAN